MTAANSPNPNLRRFACTACGSCCNRGPEMELGEAAALADRFILSLLFKVHSLPLDDRSERAAAWYRQHGSRVPLRPALEEERRQLSLFASRRRSDRRGDRQLFLTLSAIVEDDGRGHCPALTGTLCTIYEDRPLTCRTVPLHYSRSPSTLAKYLDGFVATPGHRCDIAEGAPDILDGNKILDPAIRRYRDDAITLAKADQAWKDHMLRLMDDPASARAALLPTYDDVLANSDKGYATMLPMIVAWRVAEAQGLLSADALRDLCGKQASLIRAEIAQGRATLRDTLSLYEAGRTRGPLFPLLS